MKQHEKQMLDSLKNNLANKHNANNISKQFTERNTMNVT